jgi:hypothetical protein
MELMASESSALLVLSMQQESIHFVKSEPPHYFYRFYRLEMKEQQIPNKIGRRNEWIREEQHTAKSNPSSLACAQHPRIFAYRGSLFISILSLALRS